MRLPDALVHILFLHAFSCRHVVLTRLLVCIVNAITILCVAFLTFYCSWHIKAWADGTSIKLKDCTTSGKQKFRDLSDSRQSTGPIVPRRDPNLCLTYAGDSPEKGSKLKLMGCSGRSEQDWSY